MDKSLRSVIIGTTGLCNASCIHCPTGKAETAHLPQRTMSTGLFNRIVDQLADGDWAIWGNLSLGLFGDGLLDPYVVERCEYARKRLPRAPIAVNTNGAAYNRAKHLALRDTVQAMALHVESLRPDIYNRIMYPLRFDRVITKVEMIMEDFREKVTPSIPLHRMNMCEREHFLYYFKKMGAKQVHFSSLSNRCSDKTEFANLAFAPLDGPCGAEIADNLIVDWDGQVFLCCNDFRKEEPVGDLNFQTLEGVLRDARRTTAIGHLVDGRADLIKTCANCKWDKVDQKLVGAC